MCRLLRAFAPDAATADDLTTLLDLCDSQISYRQRYLSGMARIPVLDLVTLDANNPRALAFQVAAISAHLNKLPLLSDDGLAEPQQEQARAQEPGRRERERAWAQARRRAPRAPRSSDGSAGR